MIVIYKIQQLKHIAKSMGSNSKLVLLQISTICPVFLSGSEASYALAAAGDSAPAAKQKDGVKYSVDGNAAIEQQIRGNMAACQRSIST